MKTFREFVFIIENIPEEPLVVWRKWLKDNPHVHERGGIFYDRNSTDKMNRAAREFIKTYKKTGQPPEWARTTARPSGAGTPPPGAGRSAGTPPPPPGAGRSAGTPPPPPPPRQPSGAETPPSDPSSGGRTPRPYRGRPTSASARYQTVRPPVTPTPKSGIKWKPTLGKIGTAAGITIPAAMEYKQRRDEGQSKAKAAGGVLTTAAAYGLGAKIASPIRNPIHRGAASLALGTAFATGAKPAYDWAVEKTRPARQAISKATGVNDAKKIEDLTQKIQRSGTAKPTPAHDWSKEKGKDWATLTRGGERKIYVPQIGWQFPATVNKERGKAGLPPVKDPGQPTSSIPSKGTPDYFKASSQARSTIGTRGAREIASQKGVYGTRKGSALLGTSTPATVNRQARTITTGGKTASLAPTQLVRDPKTGKQKVGDLAFRGNKAVYLARPSIQSRDTSLTARVGRALNLGRYSKEAESKAAKQEYKTALKSTQKYTKQLGITPQSATQQKLPGYGVGPKKVGPKIVGPKKIGAPKPASPGSTLIKPA